MYNTLSLDQEQLTQMTELHFIHKIVDLNHQFPRYLMTIYRVKTSTKSDNFNFQILFFEPSKSGKPHVHAKKLQMLNVACNFG